MAEGVLTHADSALVLPPGSVPHLDACNHNTNVASLAATDAGILSISPTATFHSTSLDYPIGPANTVAGTKTLRTFSGGRIAWR